MFTLVLAGCSLFSPTPPDPAPVAPAAVPAPEPAPVEPIEEEEEYEPAMDEPEELEPLMEGAPVEGIRYWAEPGDLDAYLKARSAPAPSRRVEVSTLRELIAALADDTLILLAPGRYTFDDSDLLKSRSDEADWSTLSPHYVNGTIRGVHNVVIAAATAEPTLILQPDTYAPVLSFQGVEQLGLFGLTLGHRPGRGGCMGDVLRVVESSEIDAAHLTLFGSGTEGLTAIGADRVYLHDSVITDCTQGFANISQSRVRLERMRVVGNTASLLRGFTIYRSEVGLRDVEISDNHRLVHSADPSMDYDRLFSVDGRFDIGLWHVKEVKPVDPPLAETQLVLEAVKWDGTLVTWPPSGDAGDPDELLGDDAFDD